MREFNRKVGLFALGVFGAALSTSKSKPVSALGRVATRGFLGSLAVSEYSKFKNKLDVGQIFPSEHLLGSPIHIPPSMFDTRWLVLETPSDLNQFVEKIKLNITLEDDQQETLTLEFRKLGKKRGCE